MSFLDNFFQLFFYFLSLLFWCSYYVYIGALNGVTHFSEALFMSLILDCIISVLLTSSTLILFSVSLSLWLSPFSKFFICYYTFNSRISFFWFLFCNLYLLMCFIWWDIVAVCSFASWSIISFYSILWTYFLLAIKSLLCLPSTTSQREFLLCWVILSCFFA